MWQPIETVPDRLANIGVDLWVYDETQAEGFRIANCRIDDLPDGRVDFVDEYGDPVEWSGEVLGGEWKRTIEFWMEPPANPDGYSRTCGKKIPD